jgi:hypothetical protein
MSTQSSLPAELYRYILEYPLTHRDYYNLCFTFKAISSEAFRVLYTDVQLCGYNMVDLFTTTITSSPELAKNTHTLVLDIGANVASFNQSSFDNKRLVNAINNMSNLRHLHIDKMWDHEDMEVTPINDPWTAGLVIPQLRSLHIKEHLRKPLHSYFRQISSPLPVFVTPTSVYPSFIQNITIIRCLVIDNVVYSNLETLKILVLNCVLPGKGISAPNLETIAVMTPLSPFNNGINLGELLTPYNNAKKMGLFTCSAKSIVRTQIPFSSGSDSLLGSPYIRPFPDKPPRSNSVGCPRT